MVDVLVLSLYVISTWTDVHANLTPLSYTYTWRLTGYTQIGIIEDRT